LKDANQCAPELQLWLVAGPGFEPG